MADDDVDQQKLAYFQEITGVKDSSLSHQILDAYGWDLDSAIQAMVDKDTNAIPEYEESMRGSASAGSDASRPDARVENGAGLTPGSSSSPAQGPSSPSVPVSEAAAFMDERSLFERIGDGEEYPGSSSLPVVAGSDGATFVWRVVTLPFAVLLGSYNLFYGAVGFGLWIAAGVLGAGLGALRLSGVSDQGVAAAAGTQGNIAAVVSVPSGASEASSFLREYERRYGDYHPEFQAVGFYEALRRAGQEFKLLFVYLHAPQHENSPSFCETTLRDEAVVNFINENFIAWGADVRKPEGYQMSNSLKASTFPFCAIIRGLSNERQIGVVRQVEGTRSVGEILTILQNAVEEQSHSLIARRREQEVRDLDSRLREEQDEAYRIALLADQERERREQAEAERAERERFDAYQKRVQDEKEAAQVAEISARKEASLARQRHDKALNLGSEPERGADVTHVAVRLPSGERKERRFNNTAKLQVLYDYVESLNSFGSNSFLLVSNFPRVEYGPDKLDLTLKDAGLHPRTSLFVQMQDS